MLGRHGAAIEESARLTRLLRAQQDPVYLERERRQLRVDPSAPAQER
jgi:hypothetical protein